LGLALRDLAVHCQLNIADPAVQVLRLIKDNDRELLVSAQVLDDSGYIVVRGVNLFRDVNDFIGNLPTAVIEKGPKVLCHCGLLTILCKNLCKILYPMLATLSIQVAEEKGKLAVQKVTVRGYQKKRI
jgi:hypothetical protein